MSVIERREQEQLVALQRKEDSPIPACSNGIENVSRYVGEVVFKERWEGV